MAVVLPNPAGALTITSLADDAARSMSPTPCRITWDAGATGGLSFMLGTCRVMLGGEVICWKIGLDANWAV
jgi:hypothetical protein